MMPLVALLAEAVITTPRAGQRRASLPSLRHARMPATMWIPIPEHRNSFVFERVA